MKVLTLNAWGTQGPPIRQSVLLNALCELDADILCLQEATIPGLLQSLPYSTCFHSAESGLAILSRFPLLSRRKTTYPVVSPLEPYRRQALFTELDTGIFPLWVVTTHLAWKAEDGVTRLAQVEGLLELVERLTDPLLLAGDFNSTVTEAPVQRILGSGFTDLFGSLHPSEVGITWDNRNPFIQSHSVQFPDRRIDYLFLRKDPSSRLEPMACEIVCNVPGMEGLYPSDHYGVLATFTP